ncbi:HAD family hydrolase [Armatimonas sp.]|uniref:HAD family hydrolase n=1 Tax=Armatimonas sp. TaxID=1872638 RepID=UPI00374D8D39
MRISFDLDDTLICYQESVPAEPCRFTWLAREPLRLGAKALILELQQSGHDVGIYTTSYREPWKIRLWLLCYGLRPAFVLTQRDNDAHKIHNKAPRAFGIACHVDDDETVADIHLQPEYSDWRERVRGRLIADGRLLGLRDYP